jgi:hypothetical protein
MYVDRWRGFVVQGRGSRPWPGPLGSGWEAWGNHNLEKICVFFK